MFAPFLLTIALALAYADDQSDALTLIGRLDAKSSDDRAAAYKALERLGAEAFPALRAAADTGATPVRSQVRALIDSIGRQVETDWFARPTMIRLDFRNLPIGEVVDALNDRHDLGLSIRPGPQPRRGMIIEDPGQAQRLKELRDRKITLDVAEPVPFWQAIDRLCKAAALRYDVSTRRGFATRQGLLDLLADRTGRGPVSDSGPYRVQITGVHCVFERDFTLDPDPARRGANPRGAGELTVLLAVHPQPGLMLHYNGAVMVTEATDDRGRSMLAPSAPAALDAGQADRSYQVETGRASVQVNAVLMVPDPPGTVIRRLRGKVPVTAVARGSDPIVVTLNGEGVLGRPFPVGYMTLGVDRALLEPGTEASVKVTFRVNSGYSATGATPDPFRPDFSAFDRRRALEHLELYNAAGRRLNHSLRAQTSSFDAQGFFDRYELIVTPIYENGPGNAKAMIPSELRYYRFVQAAMEIPFDFRDSRMP